MPETSFAHSGGGKIKVITLFFPGPMGGAEKVVLSGVKALETLGLNTEIWVIQEKRVPSCADDFLLEANQLGLKVKTFICYWKFDFNLARALKKKLVRAKPSIVHAHGMKAVFYGKFCAPKSSRYLITHHGVTSHTFTVRIYEKIEKWFMKRSDGVIAVSEMMKTDLERQGIPAHKISVVENLLSMRIAPREIPENKELSLVYAGRLSHEKGVHILLKAMSKLPEIISITLTIVGDGAEKESLERQARDLDSHKRIRFTGFQRDVSQYLRHADALLIPSLREGLPMTLIEACCMGLPVIGSKAGGIPLLVDDGINGLLFRVGDADDLARKLIELAHDKKSFLERAKARSTFFLHRFSPDKWAENTMVVYRDSVNRSAEVV